MTQYCQDPNIRYGKLFLMAQAPGTCPLATYAYNEVTKGTTTQKRAMPDVQARELKARALEIIRNVRDRRARYAITYWGRPVGVLIPLE